MQNKPALLKEMLCLLKTDNKSDLCLLHSLVVLLVEVKSLSVSLNIGLFY